ncbi:MAG: hypothetical protein K6G11_05105 [Lachnospiraceae bacterium]|nr:hypothetical protein [Lachnospiraceae bacterium]
MIILGLYKRFKCVAGDCYLDCCSGWKITVDNKTLNKHGYFDENDSNENNLKDIIKDNISNENVLNDITKDNISNENFLSDITSKDNISNEYIYKTVSKKFKANIIKKNDEYIILHRDGTHCSMLDEDGLCYIQRNLGEDYLPLTCRKFPRLFFGNKFLSMSASCPVVIHYLLNENIKYYETDGPGLSSDIRAISAKDNVYLKICGYIYKDIKSKNVLSPLDNLKGQLKRVIDNFMVNYIIYRSMNILFDYLTSSAIIYSDNNDFSEYCDINDLPSSLKASFDLFYKEILSLSDLLNDYFLRNKADTFNQEELIKEICMFYRDNLHSEK